MRNTNLFLTVLLFLLSSSLLANVKLPALISDHLVLQRNSRIKVWGWADPGEEILIKGNWRGGKASTKCNSDGKWSAFIQTLEAGGPYSIVVQGKNRIDIKNIMFGEVWFCSGQSNMEFTLKKLGGWSSEHFEKEKTRLEINDFSDIRLFTVKKHAARKKQEDVQGQWMMANLQHVEEFSATAWFFGLNLYRKLGIPIGLISSAWGGTGAEVWAPEEICLKDKDLKFFKNEPNKTEWWPGKPGVLYNGMVYPILNYKIRGVVWYQGETNRKEADLYESLFPAMIESWRKAWKQKFPFYYVQIAPFGYNEQLAGAQLREVQWKCQAIPRTGMVVTMDIGNKKDIHPKNKQEVGRRLALLALRNNYGYNYLIDRGPSFKKMKIDGDQVKLTFDNAIGGLSAYGDTWEQFEVAGKDRIFYPAKAQIIGESVILHCDQVAEPVAARFAFKSDAEARLTNQAGLPASSFRTDTWELEKDW
ncbi:sialate O-acetylesterase [Puteibacter caeruleilacunae]|nr:sialate O-acetylesterase [Puteibacter caeruleilacunae]